MRGTSSTIRVATTDPSSRVLASTRGAAGSEVSTSVTVAVGCDDHGTAGCVAVGCSAGVVPGSPGATPSSSGAASAGARSDESTVTGWVSTTTSWPDRRNNCGGDEYVAIRSPADDPPGRVADEPLPDPVSATRPTTRGGSSRATVRSSSPAGVWTVVWRNRPSVTVELPSATPASWSLEPVTTTPPSSEARPCTITPSDAPATLELRSSPASVETGGSPPSVAVPFQYST